MFFTSVSFLVFFSVFFLFYWFIFARNRKAQNLFLLAGSYFFYAYWDWRFLSLLIGSSLFTYVLGICISRSQNVKWKSLFVFLGVLQGLGVLFIFKYLDFFIDSFRNAFEHINIHLNLHTLNLILPLGISFYTFRTISYLLDIDKGKIHAVKDWCVFFNYVSFFPGIISGPIDRANLLIPQLNAKREFKYEQGLDGLRQILWGLFKKIVIADNCATITNQIFDNYEILPASSLLIGAFFYTIQIYTDFSGYSDMAIGSAKLIGFTITRNFDFPFFAQNIAEFWRKWHISLTSWLTDYVFMPLSIAFRDYNKKGLTAAILINFIIIGMWHGANWTFILFGFLHGCYYIPLIIKGTINKRKKIAKESLLPSFKEFINMFVTFLLVMFTFVLFRAESIDKALLYYGDLFSVTLFSKPVLSDTVNVSILSFFIVVLIAVEWVQRDKEHGLQFTAVTQTFGKNAVLSKPVRWVIYGLIIYSILCFEGKEQDFIYFRF